MVSDEPDFVWRFPLTPSEPAHDGADPLVEMIRALLADLLSFGYLTRGGQRVPVDGFVLMNDTDRVIAISTPPAAGDLETG